MEIRCSGSRDADDERNKNSAEQRIEADEVDLVIYTDGSAEEGWSNGGAAFVARKKVGDGWRMIESQRMPAGTICSSFQAEMRAIQSALQ